MDLQVPLQQLLAFVQTKVSPTAHQLVVQEQALLLQHRLVDEDVICNTTKQELTQQYGLSGGAAAALKKACPDPPGSQSLVQTSVLQGVDVQIVVPPALHGDDYEFMDTTFYDDQDLMEYLRLSGVPGLVEVVEGKQGKLLVRKVADLVQNGIYTHAPSSKESFNRVLGEVRHLQQSREDEMGRAMLQHFTSVEPQEGYELREDLRSQLRTQNKLREEDVVLLGQAKACLGSHKTYVKSAKAVKDVADRASELARTNQLRPSVQPAIMIERVEPEAEARISKACKDLQVVRFQRSGHAIKVVSRMGDVGRKQFLKF